MNAERCANDASKKCSDSTEFCDSGAKNDDLLPDMSKVLKAGESVLWIGRPDRRSLGRQASRMAIFGIGYILFVAVCIWLILLGAGKWDQGRAVVPFAKHNVIIAASTAVWFPPFGIYLLTAPFRVSARRTTRFTF